MTALRRIIPQRAAALTPEAKAEIAEQALSLYGERVMIGRHAIWAGWAVGAAGLVMMLSASVSVAVLLPLHTVETRWIAVDQATGYTGVVASAEDAPKLFSERTREADIVKYLEARENYIYQTDQVAFHLAALMSSKEEQVHYKAMHDGPLAPARALRDTGYVRIRGSGQGGTYQIMSIGEGKQDTFAYAVRFERFEVVAGQPVAERGGFYTATIHFQYRPDMTMGIQDARLNPTGFQAIYYDVKKG